jgi:beta-glucosidase
MRNTILLALAPLALVACVRAIPLEDKGCPCATGFVCCEAINKCVAPDAVCFRGQPDAGGLSESSPQAPIDGIVTPIACNASTSDRNALKYAQGYTPDPKVLSQVQTALATMSLSDKATQMRGMPASVQFTDMQRSPDTSTIRGFRYRDSSRGMNLAEDMDGVVPNAGSVNGATVGFSTAFPVSMARGAAFDLDLEYAIGEAIGDEMQAAKQTVLLAPFMNLLRHPLWGRAQETYGEDPFHVGRLASAMTVGVQQHIVAAAKHFMAYDVEDHREVINSELDEQTLREIYARHFRMVVKDAGVASVMTSYNLVNGTKSAVNRHMLTEVLRDDFGFKGFVLSDWWALPNQSPATDATMLRSTAIQAVKAGLDVELPTAINYGQLENIVNNPDGLLTKDDLDKSVERVLEQKFRFNADKLVGNIGLGTPRTSYSNGRISGDADHIELAKQAARESMVLLKNDNSTLPIQSSVTKVAVLGATVPCTTSNNGKSTTSSINFATDTNTGDLGSSRVFHDPAKGIGPFAGIQAAAPSGVVVVTGSSAADAADADFIVVVAGLTAQDEGEEYSQGNDRESLALDGKQKDPQYQGIQNKLIASVAALGKPMVVVLEGGSVIDMPWLSSVPAVVMAWYPGMVGGAALGQLLWGQVNFSGKLPFTWGKQLSEYPDFKGPAASTSFDYYVGYRYFDHANITPLYPFGHGLSYTSFEYRKLQLGCSDMSQGAVLPVVVNVANTGTVAGDEIVMVFVSYPNTKARRPAKELKGFARVSLIPGEEKQITIPVRLADLDYFQMDLPVTTSGRWVVESGNIRIMVGGSSTSLTLSGSVKVNGY